MLNEYDCGLITNESHTKYEIISGLLSEFICCDNKWSIDEINGAFGQCLLWYDEEVMANVDICDNKMVFLCNKAVNESDLLTSIDLCDINYRNNIKQCIEHMISLKDNLSGS